MTTPAVEPSGWAGLDRQAPGTREAIVSQLQRLKDAGKSSVTILVLGKGGVGKSSTVNTLIGERVRTTNPFQAEGAQPAEVKRVFEGLEVSVVDTPGLVDAGDVSERALKNILSFLCGRTVDVLVYVDRLDVYYSDATDRAVVRAITGAFGKQVWSLGLVVLTRAQMSPSDGRTYEEFVALRTAAMQGLVRKEAGLPQSQPPVPVVRVENIAQRCKANEAGENVLPDDVMWLPLLYKTVVDAALAPVPRKVIDEETVAGPDYNQRFKMIIPLVLLAQVFGVFLPLRRSIDQDKKDEKKNRPKWEIEAEEHRRASARMMNRN